MTDESEAPPLSFTARFKKRLLDRSQSLSKLSRQTKSPPQSPPQSPRGSPPTSAHPSVYASRPQSGSSPPLPDERVFLPPGLAPPPRTDKSSSSSSSFWYSFDFARSDPPRPPPRSHQPDSDSDSDSHGVTRRRAFAVDLSASESSSPSLSTSQEHFVTELAQATLSALPTREHHRRSKSGSFGLNDLSDLVESERTHVPTATAKDLRLAGATIARFSTVFTHQTPPARSSGPKGFFEFCGMFPLHQPGVLPIYLDSSSPPSSPPSPTSSPTSPFPSSPTTCSSSPFSSSSGQHGSPSLSPSTSPSLSPPSTPSSSGASSPVVSLAGGDESAPPTSASAVPRLPLPRSSSPSKSSQTGTPRKQSSGAHQQSFSHRSYILQSSIGSPRRGLGRRTTSLLETLDHSVEAYFQQQVSNAKQLADVELRALHSDIAASSTTSSDARQQLLGQIQALLDMPAAQWCEKAKSAQMMAEVRALQWSLGKGTAERAWGNRMLIAASGVSHAAMYFTLNMTKVDALVFMQRSIKAFRRQRECDLALVRDIDAESPPAAATAQPPVVVAAAAVPKQQSEAASWQQSPTKPGSKTRNRVAMCRMCENNIQKNRFQQHSKVCLEFTQVQTQIHFIDETLHRILRSLPPAAGQSPSSVSFAVPPEPAAPDSPRRHQPKESTRSSPVISRPKATRFEARPRRASDASGAIDDMSVPLRQLLQRVLNTRASISDDAWQICGTTLRLLVELISRIRRSGGSCDVLLAAASLMRKKQYLLKDQKLRLIHLDKDLAGFGFHRHRPDVGVDVRHRTLSSSSSSSSLASPPVATLAAASNYLASAVKQPKRTLTIADFEIIKPISRGSFGQVVLARKKATGDVYAIKIQSKREMVRKNQDKYARNERNILALTHGCPYVVKLFYSFQSADSLYLVMEYLNGGDCFSLLRVFGSFSLEMTRLYVGETVLALEYLHERGIVHRDLKPDNLLIGADGHIKLTDFGLSAMGLVDRHQELRQKTSWQHLLCQDAGETQPDGVEFSREFVGTPDYVAPEIFLGLSYDQAVDWWSLGCICYEFFVGVTPFYGDTLDEVIARTLDGTIAWPDDDDTELTPVAKEFIVKLLRQQPAERLGAHGAKQVKADAFFAEINWDTISQTRAEFVPKTKGDSDTSYFDARNEVWTPDENIADTLRREAERDDVVDEETAKRFRRFSFINLELLQSVDQQSISPN